jgi:hypothetical protein
MTVHFRKSPSWYVLVLQLSERSIDAGQGITADKADVDPTINHSGSDKLTNIACVPQQNM